MNLSSLLTDESLDFARRHLTKFYDSDFFPKSFEFDAIWHKWDEFKALPRDNIVPNAASIAIPWRKARGGFRVVHQLNPFDAIVYTAMTYAVSKQVESRRRSNTSAACSYRINIDSGGFFSSGSGFENYREKCEGLADKHDYVLMTDISDFYNQIYLHRLENAISDATTSEAGKYFENFLLALNNKNSQGIPVGPAASIILSEAVLIDVDEFIADRGFSHVRYVDDIRIFADSQHSLDVLLQDLTLYLHQSHRLGLVGDKTKILNTQDFLQRELNNQYQLEKLEILDDIESSDFYSNPNNEEYLEHEEVDEADVDDEPIGVKLLKALERIAKHDHLDMGLARAILRRARNGKHEEIIDFVFQHLMYLRPVINDVVLYLEAVTSEANIYDIQSSIRELMANNLHHDTSVAVWFSWYVGNHEVLSKDLDLREIYKRTGRISNLARSMVKAKKLNWVREQKDLLLSYGSWDKRAVIYAAQLLTKDERDNWLKPLKKNNSLDLLDKWMIDWVIAGLPKAEPLPEPELEFDFDILEGDLPF